MLPTSLPPTQTKCMIFGTDSATADSRVEVAANLDVYRPEPEQGLLGGRGREGRPLMKQRVK